MTKYILFDLLVVLASLVVMSDGQCFNSLTDIYEAESEIMWEDTVENRTYILCPDTLFETGGPDQKATVPRGSQYPIIPRRNMKILCGDNGSSANNCTIQSKFGRRGTFVLAIAEDAGFYFSFDDPRENNLDGFMVSGVTVTQDTRDFYLSALSFLPGDKEGKILFNDIIVKDAVKFFGFHFENTSVDPGKDMGKFEVTFQYCKFKNITNALESVAPVGTNDDPNPAWNYLIFVSSTATKIIFDSNVFEGNDMSRLLYGDIILSNPDRYAEKYRNAGLVYGEALLEFRYNCFIDNSATDALITNYDYLGFLPKEETLDIHLTSQGNFVSGGTVGSECALASQAVEVGTMDAIWCIGPEVTTETCPLFGPTPAPTIPLPPTPPTSRPTPSPTAPPPTPSPIPPPPTPGPTPLPLEPAGPDGVSSGSCQSPIGSMVVIVLSTAIMGFSLLVA